MKITAFRNKETRFTADLWTFTESTGPDGTNQKHFTFDRNITVNLVTGNFGKLDVFFADSESDVRAFDQLFNLRTTTGMDLRDKAVYQVEMVAPFLNMFGQREGFKARIAFIGISD